MLAHSVSVYKQRSKRNAIVFFGFKKRTSVLFGQGNKKQLINFTIQFIQVKKQKKNMLEILFFLKWCEVLKFEIYIIFFIKNHKELFVHEKKQCSCISHDDLIFL